MFYFTFSPCASFSLSLSLSYMLLLLWRLPPLSTFFLGVYTLSFFPCSCAFLALGTPHHDNGIPLPRRNSARIHLPTHTAIEWCSRMQELAHPQSSKGHAKREAYAQVILGRCCKHRRLPHEPVHNIRSARGHSLWEELWKQVRSIPCKDIRLHCIRAHPRQKEAEGYKWFNPSTGKPESTSPEPISTDHEIEEDNQLWHPNHDSAKWTSKAF